MPIASGGRCSRLPELRFSTSSMITATTPMIAPWRIIGQSRLPPSTPWAIVEMIAACGAASAVSLAPGAPWKVKAVFMRSRIGGMTSAPNTTPRTSATCWRHGVASTSWPVFRSWRLLLEMVATPKMMAVTNKAKATSDLVASPLACGKSAARISEMPSTERMPTPEIGLFDAPIRPAM